MKNIHNSKKFCPNCEQYTFETKRSRLLIGAFASFMAGGLFTILIITIPLGLIAFVIGIVCLAAAPFSHGRICTHCKYQTAF